MSDLTDAQYNVLLTFRCALREFLRWSEQEAGRVGLTPQQHQLLLAVRAHSGDHSAPSIGEIATYLQIRHHSAVGLVRRVEELDLLRRCRDAQDRRVVRLYLTEQGAELIARLSKAHLAELEHVADLLHLSESFLHRLSVDFIDTIPGRNA